VSERPAEGITYQEQLDRWAAGESVHREGGCCPDFSCCKPELGAAPEVRQAFVCGSEDVRMGFLGTFLQAAVDLAASEHPSHRDGDRVVISVLGAPAGASS
jgi:hypothetical protein